MQNDIEEPPQAGYMTTFFTIEESIIAVNPFLQSDIALLSLLLWRVPPPGESTRLAEAYVVTRSVSSCGKA
jgi:hypothetical protein